MGWTIIEIIQVKNKTIHRCNHEEIRLLIRVLKWLNNSCQKNISSLSPTLINKRNYKKIKSLKKT